MMTFPFSNSCGLPVRRYRRVDGRLAEEAFARGEEEDQPGGPPRPRGHQGEDSIPFANYSKNSWRCCDMYWNKHVMKSADLFLLLLLSERTHLGYSDTARGPHVQVLHPHELRPSHVRARQEHGTNAPCCCIQPSPSVTSRV